MGLQSKKWDWVSGFEEKEGVMRNAMTTRAPGGAKKNMEKPTDRTKLFFEISNFRDHFSRKDFFVALVF